jgi:Carbon-nitrogen hydrolase
MTRFGEVPARIWLPDLFAHLCMRLRERINAVFSWGLSRCPEQRAMLDNLRRAIERAPDGAAPKEIINYLDEHRGELLSDLIVALAIDDAFEGLRRDPLTHRAETSLPAAIHDVRQVYLMTGNCAKDNRFIVLPSETRSRRQATGSGDSVDLLFENLRVLAHSDIPSPWRVLSQEGIKRHRFDATIVGGDGGPDSLRIAFIPLAQSRKDVSIRGFLFQGEPRVTIGANKRQEELLKTRAEQALKIAAGQGANIVVMPEWVVSPGVADAISKAISSIYGTNQSLQLVIAGTGSTKQPCPSSGIPYAECIVFDAQGGVVWRQRKMHHWQMDEKAQKSAGLREYSTLRREHFESHDEIIVADTPLGRCVVLICEDFHQDVPSRAVLNALRPRWIFVPILDTLLKAGRWSPEKAAEIAARMDSNVVISNSMVMARPVYKKTRGIGWFVSRHQPGNFYSLEVDKVIRAPGELPIVLVTWMGQRERERRRRVISAAVN